MRLLLGAIAGAIMLGLSGAPAEAKFYFGKEEMIHRLQDVSLMPPSGEPLFLGHKTASFSFLLGLYLTDDGYVLGVRSDRKRYFPMPQGAELADLQRRGLLPNPLPAYAIPTFDYVKGYSLWLALPIVVMLGLVQQFIQRRKRLALERDPFAGI